MVGNGVNRRGGPVRQGETVDRVADGRLEHLAQGHGAVVAQEQHPGIEGAGNDGGEQAGARHQADAALPVGLDGRRLRGHALAADDDGLVAVRPLQDDRRIAARAVQMRLDDLQGEAGGNGGVERIAAALQYAHAYRRADPMGAGDGAERAADFRSGGEALGHEGPFARYVVYGSQ